MSGREKPIPMSSTRVTNLRGEANVPGDKSISHRSINSLVPCQLEKLKLVAFLKVKTSSTLRRQ